MFLWGEEKKNNGCASPKEQTGCERNSLKLAYW
jgi:hypothetical protein